MFDIEKTSNDKRVRISMTGHDDPVVFSILYPVGALNALSRALKKVYPADVINGNKFYVRPLGEPHVGISFKVKDGEVGFTITYDYLREKINSFVKGKSNGKEDRQEDAQE